MRALHFAIVTEAGLCQVAFLFLATNGSMTWTDVHRRILRFRSTPVWIPVLPVLLELLPHAATRCEDHRYEAHTKLLASECILVNFRLLCGSGPCIRVEKRLAACTAICVADCIWIHYAHE